ncbi:MAG: Rrf2 family transcriptional regulator [Patescibacteria group bacterium]|nr:Rrf2 family transcriptional regulator [Patescibacteria group bacterium]MDD5554987.1 Rrf2 family transcriptional regulator [Patescibacteria group bacterium]
MKFSTRTTYGLRAMIRLAGHKDKKPLPLPNIAKAENISLGYLESMFSDLKKGGLVKAGKGVKGGYQLGKPANKITVFDIVRVLEGKMSLFHCLAEDGRVYCNAGCRCGAALVLSKVQKSLKKTLKGIKLSDLI